MAMALTACGSDEALQEYEHQQDNKYPLLFTATMEDGTETRVTADNKWSNGDEIGIQIGTSGEQQGKYTYVANDGNGTWSPEIPVSWQEGQTDVTVTAWHPYDQKENADISNQADGYTQCEFLKAEETGQSSQQTVNLTFKHQMAKVMCRVQDNRLRYIRGAKVRFRGYTSVKFNKGEVTAHGTNGEITPYSIDHGDYTTYVALLAPQTIAAGGSFIEVTANGKTYRFKPNAEIVLKAGMSHNYNIKIGDEIDYAIDDNSTYHVYTAEGLNKWTEVANTAPYNASCILENNITLTGENNWTPVCQNNGDNFTGTFDGNGKFISGLNITSTSFSVGFIGDLGEGGTVKNLTLKAAKISGSSYVGSVVGYNCGTIENCHVTEGSEIKGSGNPVGGVVGDNLGNILACHVAEGCSVYGDKEVGGIAGCNDNAVTGCYALCSLKGNECIGGISGCSHGGIYTACYSKCSYSSGSNIGGIVGSILTESRTFTACYWLGDGNCTKGVGNLDDTIVEVDGTEGKTWADAATAMNTALGSNFGYQYEVNSDSQIKEPLKLVKKP